MDSLPLPLPVAFIPHNVQQEFIRLHVVLPHHLRGLPDHVLGQPSLPRYLHGERAPRVPYRKLEQGAHLLPVIEHRPVHHPPRARGEKLEVLVVRGHHPVCPPLHYALQHSLSYRPPYRRLRTTPHLVHQHQAPPRAPSHHRLHVQQVARIGGQVILYTLLIANVNEDIAEHPHPALLSHRYGQTALKHILQQPHRLQTYRLTPCVGSRDDKDTLLGRQPDVQGNHLPALPPQCEVEQRVASTDPVHHGFIPHPGHHSPHLHAEAVLSQRELHVSQELHGPHQLWVEGAQPCGDVPEDTNGLPPLLRLELTYPVVSLHHLGRLYEHRFARCALVVHYASDAPFHVP